MDVPETPEQTRAREQTFAAEWNAKPRNKRMIDGVEVWMDVNAPPGGMFFDRAASPMTQGPKP